MSTTLSRYICICLLGFFPCRYEILGSKRVGYPFALMPVIKSSFKKNKFLSFSSSLGSLCSILWYN